LNTVEFVKDFWDRGSGRIVLHSLYTRCAHSLNRRLGPGSGIGSLLGLEHPDSLLKCLYLLNELLNLIMLGRDALGIA
jgi:hypothetical protein